MHDALQKKGVDATDINICTYVSLNNEITIKDVAEGLDRAVRNHQVLRDEDQEFDAIVHSTGMLVLRSWLTNYRAAVGANTRLARIRQFGFLANRVRQHKLEQCRTLLAVCQPYTLIRSDLTAAAKLSDPSACPICKQGRLIVIQLLAAEPIPTLDTS